MTAEPTARETAERIATECVGPVKYPGGHKAAIISALITAIESALLAHGRRERARGLREAFTILSHTGGGFLHLVEERARAYEQRAREPEEGK